MQRLLFIEDDQHIRKALKLALEDEGYEIVEASDIGGNPLCATLWAQDEVGNNGTPTGILVEVCDEDDCLHPEAHWDELAKFAASNGNEEELAAALKP